MDTREQWLNLAVDELRPLFDANGYPLPERIRVTCGFPSRHARSLNRAIGEHHSPTASSDNTHEILISPVESDVFEVFGILVHELAHAATDGDGHRGRFPACIRRFYLEGKPTSTNPIASIFAWTQGLSHRGRMDGTPAVTEFAETLERVCVETVEEGKMTKDLALLISKDAPWLTTQDFLAAIDANLQKAMAGK